MSTMNEVDIAMGTISAALRIVSDCSKSNTDMCRLHALWSETKHDKLSKNEQDLDDARNKLIAALMLMENVRERNAQIEFIASNLY